MSVNSHKVVQRFCFMVMFINVYPGMVFHSFEYNLPVNNKTKSEKVMKLQQEFNSVHTKADLCSSYMLS